MKYWNEFSENTYFNKIFTTLIEIGVVDIFSIDIDNDRGSISINFDIKEFPSNPPLMWQENEFNTCRLGLDCGSIGNLVIKNMPALGEFNMTITNEEGLFFVRMSNPKSLVEFTTRLMVLTEPRAFNNGE